MSQYDSLFSTDEAERIKSEGHPFALPDLWRSSALTDSAVGGTLFDLDLNSLPLPSKPSLPQETPLFRIPHELRLPPLPGLNTDANVWPPALLDDPEFRSDPTTAADDDDDENLLSSVVGDYDHSYSHGDEGAYSDVWLDPETVQPPRDPRFFTWDSFLVPGANEPQNGYLTETGPGVLDVALEERGETGVVVRTDVFCTVRPAFFLLSCACVADQCANSVYCIWDWAGVRCCFGGIRKRGLSGLCERTFAFPAVHLASPRGNRPTLPSPVRGGTDNPR